MANCPRCGTADFYPSFSGKGECLKFGCELFSMDHYNKMIPGELPAPSINYRITVPETSEVEKSVPANGWAPVTYKIGPIWSYNGSVTLPPMVEPEQAVDGNVGGEEPQPPDDAEDYDLTLRETTVAVGILSTYMCGLMPTVAGCRSIAKQLVDNCGIRLHTWSKTMPHMKPQKCDVWFLGARRTLEARSLGTGHLSFIIR